MNTFFVFDDGTMVTPPLTGTILPGITRDSIITLAAERGDHDGERPSPSTSGAPMRRAVGCGGFACGTAAVITPIGTVRSPRRDSRSAGARSGTSTMGLRDELVDIQRGKVADTHGWVYRVA